MNILALDLPGHGNTPGPGRTSIALYADWVVQTLGECFFEPVFLGGHSMGGAITLETGLKYPDKIQGLVLLATGAALAVSPEILSGLQDQPQQTLVKINQWSYGKGTSPLVIGQSIEWMKQTPLAVIYGDFQACQQFNRRKSIAHIKKPTLILVGDQDVMAPPKASSFLKEKIPFSRLVTIPGAGHMVMLEKHKEVNQAIREFIFQHS